MTMNKTKCFYCDEEEDIYECKGCSQIFCFNHLKDHRKTIDEDLNQTQYELILFQQKLDGQKNNPVKHPLISKIDQWEQESIEKIKEIAEQCRNRLIKYTNELFIDLEENSNTLLNQINEFRTKNKCNEINLNNLKEKLNNLQKELDQPSNVSVEQQPTSFINTIIVTTPFYRDQTWEQYASTVAGGNGHENRFDQLLNPGGVFIDDDQTIYIADCGNHRVVEWRWNASLGKVVAGGNGSGNKMNQLNSPADVIFDQEQNSFIIADSGNRRIMRWFREDSTHGQIIVENIDCSHLTMDKNGSLYVSDSKKNEVRRWKKGETNGIIVAGGNGKGDHLNQLNSPSFIFVSEDESLYISDSENHRVMKWSKNAKEGVIVAGGNGQGSQLTQISYPEGLMVDRWNQIYVTDSDNDRIMRWHKGAKEGTVIVGGKSKGQQSNQLYYPTGVSFDREGNLYVVDGWNDRVQKFKVQ